MTRLTIRTLGRWLVPLALLGAAGAAFGADAAVAKTAAAPLTITLDAGAKGGAVSDALRIVLLLTLLAVLPAILIAMTSFTRTIIVLSMLRHAFGMQDTPPNMVLVSLALFLTLFTMAPSFQAAYQNGIKPMIDNRIEMESAVTQSVKPLREFMIHQTREKDLALILEIAKVPVPDSIDEVSTIHIIPAFLISELKTAFTIGFVIFLPFLLLDLVVSSVLMSMGMLMVPPTMISLPLKVLMFVLIDGWALTIRALLGSFH
jgi:flagellar biosynthesis protein FliP